MALRTLVVFTVASVVAATTQVSARAPAPLVPTALVEDVTSATADVEFMDYVGNRQVIKLGPSDILVLSYLKSCEHETITGGTVVVGADRSEVQGGQVVRTKVPCDGGNIQLSAQQANQSAASAFRLQSADTVKTLYASAPVVQLPRNLAGADRVLIINRTDGPGESHRFEIDDAIIAARFYDLAKTNLSLARGATYDASIGSHKVTFRIDPSAASAPTPVVSRLLRFQ
jgi:hypothetical protein